MKPSSPGFIPLIMTSSSLYPEQMTIGLFWVICPKKFNYLSAASAKYHSIYTEPVELVFFCSIAVIAEFPFAHWTVLNPARERVSAVVAKTSVLFSISSINLPLVSVCIESSTDGRVGVDSSG